MKVKLKNIDVSIIIVNYKTPRLLFECISSLELTPKIITYEVIVVDNNSEDNSEELILEAFPYIRWFNTGYNSGFARANNIGIKQAKGNYVLLLNSDTIVNENTLINTLTEYIQLEKLNTKIGVLGCQLIDLNGNIQHNSRPKIRNIEKIIVSHPLIILLFRVLKIKPEDKNNTRKELDALHSIYHETAWLGGTYLFYNRKISSEFGSYLDEDFFMYGEDIEWTLRLRKQGYKHFFTPKASIIHAEGGSFKVKTQKRVQIFVSEWLFIMKFYGKIVYFFVAMINLSGLILENYLIKKHLKKYKNNNTNIDLEMFEIKKEVVTLLKKYFFRILFKFKRKTSSSKEYLKVI